MFSDTALASCNSEGDIVDVQPNVKKIIHLRRANIGLGLWGEASVEVCNRRLPLLKYLAEQVNMLPYDSHFDDIASAVRSTLSRSKDSLLVSGDGCGVHLAGFHNGDPMLYHICPNPAGSDFNMQQEFPHLWATRLERMGLDTVEQNGFYIAPEYADTGTASGAYWHPSEGERLGIYPVSLNLFSEQVNPVERVYLGLHSAGFFHLRNGCGYPRIADMFDEEYGSDNPVEIIRQNRNLPNDNSNARIEAYLELVGSVVDGARGRAAEGELVALSRPLDFFVFNSDGIVTHDNNNSSLDFSCSLPEARFFV